jgi:hypothetical protein
MFTISPINLGPHPRVLCLGASLSDIFWSFLVLLEKPTEVFWKQSSKLVCPGLYQVAPMSVYACLGNDAAAIRDAFLIRLQSRIEDMRIKVMILEFLTVAVETQPGLIELFLNLEAKDGSDGSKVSLYFMRNWVMASWEVQL